MTIHSANPETLANASTESKEQTLKRVADETTDKVRDFAAETTEAAGETAELVVAEAREKMTKASDAARDFTVKQPLATVAGAMAVGVLIGMALKQRH